MLKNMNQHGGCAVGQISAALLPWPLTPPQATQASDFGEPDGLQPEGLLPEEPQAAVRAVPSLCRDILRLAPGESATVYPCASVNHRRH